MSHVATIDCEVKDLECLGKAAKRLGMEMSKAETYRWWGHSVGYYPLPQGFTAADLGKCNYKLSIPGDARAYEVGVVQRDGKIVLLWDFYLGGYGLQDKVGKDAGLLSQAYQAEVAIKTAIASGYGVEEETLEDGTINVYAVQGY